MIEQYDPQTKPWRILPIRVRVDLEVTTMKVYTTRLWTSNAV